MPSEGAAIGDSIEENNRGDDEADERKQRSPQRRRAMQAESGFQQATFPLNGGDALVQWPENLSAEELEDFEDWLGLVIRKVKRSVSRKRSEPDKEAEAESAQ